MTSIMMTAVGCKDKGVRAIYALNKYSQIICLCIALGETLKHILQQMVLSEQCKLAPMITTKAM